MSEQEQAQVTQPVAVPIDMILKSMREVIGNYVQKVAVLEATISTLQNGQSVNIQVGE